MASSSSSGSTNSSISRKRHRDAEPQPHEGHCPSNPSSSATTIFLINDLASHLLQWCTVADVVHLSITCFDLSFLPFHCRFSASHVINVEKFVHGLVAYEKAYDSLLAKIKCSSSSSRLLASLSAPADITSRFYSSSLSWPSSSSSLMETSGALNLASACPFDSASALASTTASVSSRGFLPHSHHSLRSLRLVNLSFVSTGGMPPCKQAERFLSILRRRMLHFDSSVRVMEVLAERSIIWQHPPFSPSFLPRSLQSLQLTVPCFSDGELPSSLEVLDTGEEFNGQLRFPANSQLRKLILNGRQTFSKGQLPTTLEEVIGYNQCPMPGDGVLPNSLKVLEFYREFNGQLVPAGLPTELDTLILSAKFSHAMPLGVLPPMLQHLRFDAQSRFGGALSTIAFPASLRSLQLPFYGVIFTQPLLAGQLNEGLTVLDLQLSRTFNQPFAVGVLPSTLVHLYLSFVYSQRFLPFALPASLRLLAVFSNEFPVDCLKVVGVLPPSFECLAVSTIFNDVARVFDQICADPSLLPEALPALYVVIYSNAPFTCAAEARSKLKQVCEARPTLRIRCFQSLNAKDQEEVP